MLEPALRQVPQGVGVEDHRQAGGEHRFDGGSGVVAVPPAGSEQVGLAAARGRDHIRESLHHNRSRAFVAEEADHAGAGVHGAADGQQPGTGIVRGSGVDAHHTAGVLVAGRARIRPGGGQLGQLPLGQLGLPRVEWQADVDQGHRTGERSRGFAEQAGFPGAEGDGGIGRETGLTGARTVGIQARGQVDRDHVRGSAAGGVGDPGEVTRQPGPATDAEAGVDHLVEVPRRDPA